MLIVILFMLGGLAVGRLLRKHRLQGVGRLITALIWLLLFLLGWEVGSNRQLIASLPTLGGEAWLLATAAALGSAVAAWGLKRILRK